MSHHTPEEIKAAFALAPTVLRELTDLGVQLPSLELFEDASGTLWIGSNITKEQLECACNLVRSTRIFTHPENGIGIRFCCGLVEAAKETAAKLT